MSTNSSITDTDGMVENTNLDIETIARVNSIEEMKIGNQ
jgi:GTPase